MKLNIILCLANDRILGVNNDLYVKIQEDLKYFRKITSDNYYKDKPNVLIMGYNTFKSIGKSRYRCKRFGRQYDWRKKNFN